MKFDMEVPGIKIQLKFDFGIRRFAKVKVHSSLNIRKCGFHLITLVTFDGFQ